MAFNGAGIFVRLYNWVNDRNAGILIRADRMDAEMDGMATALTDCVTRDGQSPALANLPMATFIHTTVGNATARNHYAALGQVQDAIVNWIAAAGTADVITAAYNPVITALSDGQICFFRASAANATTAPTFSPNGLTARTITKSGGSAIAVGDIPAANAEVILRYNLANTRWELMNPASGIPLGTGVAAFLATPSSANLRTALTDETGTGSAVFANTPTLVTPVLGAATATSINFGGSTLSAFVDSTSFTPTLSFGGASVGITYSVQSGKYSRIGNIVIFTLQVNLSSKGSSTGVAAIGGLPINCTPQTAISIFGTNLAVGTTTSLQAIIGAGGTSILLYKYAAGSATQLANTDFGGSDALNISGAYLAT